MRTVANIRAGGRTPVSGALHSIFLLSIVFGLGNFAERIPLAVLAGILLKVGIDIVDWHYIALSLRSPRPGVVIMMITMLLTVLIDLVTAVGVGFVMASLLFLKRSADAQIRDAKVVACSDTAVGFSEKEKEILDRMDGRIAVFEVSGPLAFGSAKAIVHLLNRSAAKEHLIMDFAAVPFIDSTAALALDEVILRMQDNDFNVSICGAREEVLTKLQKLGILRNLPRNEVFENRLAALQHAEQSQRERDDVSLSNR
jgi:SulP family sulfate permease